MRRDADRSGMLPLLVLLALGCVGGARAQKDISVDAPGPIPVPRYVPDPTPVKESVRRPTEISTSVILTGFWDLEGQVNGKTPCQFVVGKSKPAGGSRINIVVTLNGLGAGGNGLSGYAFKDYQGNFLPASKDTIARWERGVKECVKAAVNAGFTTIHVIPHVDPIQKNGMGIWRNVVKFDPLAKYGPPGQQFSYDEVLLRPTARAIAAVIKPTTLVEFTLTGEQGLSVFSYPKNWSKLLDSTKAITAAGRDRKLHLTGISLNWDKLCGCVEPEERDPILYNNTYAQRFARWSKAGGASKIDVPGVKALFDKADFLGASGYASMNLQPTFNEMERTLQTVAYEMQFFGMSLKDYMFKKNKPFVYSEQGVGGCSYNRRVAPNVEFVAKHPWLGLWPNNGWESSSDPWAKPDFRAYRRKFYDVMTSWAAIGGGPQYRIDGIYMWSVGTWDPLGVHPATFGNGGSFSDPVITERITKHNRAVQAAQKGR